MTAREPTAQEKRIEAAAATIFCHAQFTGDAHTARRLAESALLAAPSPDAVASPAESKQAPLVYGDQVLISATYIANTRERAPPLSDRAWVRIEGDDHLTNCPIAAIEKRGALRDDKLYRCNICGFIVDASYAAEKPTVDFDMRGRHKPPPAAPAKKE